MRLTVAARNWLVDRVANRLNGGTLAIYAGSLPLEPLTESAQAPLVELRFASQAFYPAEQGLAEAYDIQPAVVRTTGEAGWAQLVTSTGEQVGDVRVRAVDALDVELGDVLVDRTDFHRGGLCEVGRVTLTVPLRP